MRKSAFKRGGKGKSRLTTKIVKDTETGALSKSAQERHSPKRVKE